MGTRTSHPTRGSQRFIAALMDMPLLEREREQELAKKWRNRRDSEALSELVVSHGRLVVRIAWGFRSSGLPIDDLVQEGNIGLMEAADRFDPERGVRFSTYASWWIVAAIQNYILRNYSLVRVATTPAQRRLFFNLRRARARFEGANGFSADDRERIAAQLEVTVSDVERMEVHLSRPDQSLNQTVGEDDNAELQDLMAGDQPTPEDIAAADSARETRARWIRHALHRLTPRERQIIVSRFLGDRRITLAEIGETFGVSKERIRQIEGRALAKLQAALSEVVENPSDLLSN